jgi:hypothetical protein
LDVLQEKKNTIDVAPHPQEEENDEAVDEELYRVGDLISFTVGNDQSLIYSRSNRRVSIFPTFTTSLLPYCDSFKTIEEHAEACIRTLRMGAQQIDFVYDSLSNLAEAGLLITFRAVSELQKVQVSRSHQRYDDYNQTLLSCSCSGVSCIGPRVL